MQSVENSVVELQDFFDNHWVSETEHICKIQTYRNSPTIPNQEVNSRLMRIRKWMNLLASESDHQLTNKFVQFQWAGNLEADGKTVTPVPNPDDDQCIAADYWIFGLRIGSSEPSRKYTIICHLDTVPATESDSWGPYDPHVEFLVPYPAGTVSPQDFLVGRGCVDDKGPAVSAFITARQLAKDFDKEDVMKNVQFEILFDTSEETDMATPHYLEDPTTRKPTFGIVYDSQWCVRAEKGIERPKFSFSPRTIDTTKLHIHSLVTAPNNSVNTIPDWAEAVIKGDYDKLSRFADAVSDDYYNYDFPDDDTYGVADLEATFTGKGDQATLNLRTIVKGAQHGSAPEENRADGANPLVSLANYLAGKVQTEEWGKNDYGTVAEFIGWMWGTHVFGENREGLEASDDVFRLEDNNGTTYAVTKVCKEEGKDVSLEVDIRYATTHHTTDGWDGEEEGLMDGDDGLLSGIFSTLVEEFNDKHCTNGGGYGKVTFVTTTVFPPDIRFEDGDNMKVVREEYKNVRNKDAPLFGIGGGTDAKGYTFLLGVGPLFDQSMGQPINYHGIEEGAPIADMRVSTEIIYRIMRREILHGSLPLFEKAAGRNIERGRALRLRTGFKRCCEC